MSRGMEGSAPFAVAAESFAQTDVDSLREALLCSIKNVFAQHPELDRFSMTPIGSPKQLEMFSKAIAALQAGGNQ